MDEHFKEPEEGEEIVICASCNCDIEPDDDRRESVDGIICDACFVDSYASCDICDAAVHKDDTTYDVQGCVMYCSTCIRAIPQCNDCGNYIFDNEDLISDNSLTLCRECYGDNYYTCDNCEVIVHNDDMRSNDNGCYCEDCYSEQHNDSIESYHSKQPLVFHGEGIQYGIELETDFNNDNNQCSCADDLKEHDEDYDNHYQTADSSLDCGIEIVFQPRDMESWSKYKVDMKHICKIVLNNDGRSYDTTTCGIHIHRSRVGLDDLLISKLIMFFVKYQDKIQKVAQRRDNTYCRYSFCEDQEDIALIYKKYKNEQIRERYIAINFQNRDTIEFRIFKGTLYTDSIYAYLEFCDSIIEFLKTVNFSHLVLKEDVWERYIIWLNDSKGYFHIRNHIIKKGAS